MTNSYEFAVIGSKKIQKPSTVRITGDCHGLTKRYIENVSAYKCDYSLQIGDMGFDYCELSKLDSECHKFIGGNHDNYDLYYDCPNSLGDFGTCNLGPLEFFFIRGAFSIDAAYRIASYYSTGVTSWWKKEQLDLKDQALALTAYKLNKPKAMITHTCPTEISKIIGNPQILANYGFKPERFNTDTQQLLQDCFDFHKPEVHIFGHFHVNLDFTYKGTRFICVDELCSIEYKDGKILNMNKTRKIKHKGVKNV